MKEEFLHYIWQSQLFNKTNLHTEENQNLEIISAGMHNHDSGPDFFNAQIKINGMVWSGNVEIHLLASDWLKHNHQNDNAYNNVILHVLWENDIPLKSNFGKMLPALVLKNRIEKKVLENYLELQNSENEIACSSSIKKVPEIKITNWMSRLLAERFEQKIFELKNELQQNGNNWEETFYRHLARQFGMKVNAEPFQCLAQTIPFKIISRHRNNLLQTEALLFGQSGLLLEFQDDVYAKKLLAEYSHLKIKYKLNPLSFHHWKFMRLRPYNFPTLRIAQLANLFFQQDQLFRKCMETTEISEFATIFNVSASDYWNDHYRFGKISKVAEKNLGQQAVQTILINTVAPFKFLYGRMKGDENIEQEAISLLEKINSEENKIIREWKKNGVKSKSSADSQALIELKKKYCERKKCLDCHIGNYLLTEKLEGNRFIRSE